MSVAERTPADLELNVQALHSLEKGKRRLSIVVVLLVLRKQALLLNSSAIIQKVSAKLSIPP